MGHKPWDMPWKRRDKRRERQQWQAEVNEPGRCGSHISYSDGYEGDCKLQDGHEGFCWDGQMSWGRFRLVDVGG